MWHHVSEIATHRNLPTKELRQFASQNQDKYGIIQDGIKDSAVLRINTWNVDQFVEDFMKTRKTASNNTISFGEHTGRFGEIKSGDKFIHPALGKLTFIEMGTDKANTTQAYFKDEDGKSVYFPMTDNRLRKATVPSLDEVRKHYYHCVNCDYALEPGEERPQECPNCGETDMFEYTSRSRKPPKEKKIPDKTPAWPPRSGSFTTHKTAGLPPEYHHFVKLTQQSDNRELEKKRNRISKDPKYRGPQSLADRVMAEIGGELNLLTRKFGSHEAAINTVAPKYGLDKPLIRKLFYDTGAPAQYVLSFDMEKGQKSHAMTLRGQLQDLKAQNTPWEQAKPTILQKAATLKTKDPAHQATIIKAIEDAPNYEKADGALVNLHLAMTGLRAASQQAHVYVSYIIPWRHKTWIKKAQDAAKTRPSVTIKAYIKGLSVIGDHQELAAAGLTQPNPKVTASVRQATLRPEITFYQTVTHPSGKVTAEFQTTLSGQEAQKLARETVKAGAIQALVFDHTGRPHNVTATEKGTGTTIHVDPSNRELFLIDARKYGFHVVPQKSNRGRLTFFVEDDGGGILAVQQLMEKWGRRLN